jgi:DNA-binding FrmR family transcriptional regulator
MINEKIKNDSMTRLKKIEGQIRGIMKMVDQEKYCIDIINQITAAEKALDGVAKKIMQRHIESCVTEAIIQGEGQNKIDELIETVFKVSNRRNK